MSKENSSPWEPQAFALEKDDILRMKARRKKLKNKPNYTNELPPH